MRQDEAKFTKSTFAQAQLYGLLRAVLKTGRRYRAPALTPALRGEDRIVVEPAEVKLELDRHFAQAEKAKEVHFTAVQQTQACLGWDDAADAIDVEGCPTVAQVASALASMRSRRAPGISGLPADIFKTCPVAASQLHTPIYLKILARKRHLFFGGVACGAQT